MEDFIKLAVEQLGINEDQGRSAAGGVFDLIKKQMADGDFAELANKLPGLDGLLEAAPSGDGGGGGLLGAAASMLGGKAGAALDLTKVLQDAGLDLEQAGPFLKLLVDFLKDKLGDSDLGKLLENVPGLGG